MKENPAKPRLIALAVLFGVFLLIFLVKIYDYQIVHGDEYLARSVTSNATAQEVEASRGIQNQKVLTVLLGVFIRRLRDADDVRAAFHGKHRRVGLFAVDLQLFDRGRTVNVERGE